MMTDRRRAERKAQELVERELSVPFLHVRLDAGKEDHQTHVKIFKLLFHQEDPDYKMALWNRLTPYGNDSDYDLLTPEERQFV